VSVRRRFSQYVALGDSMSIDLYPALDAGETDVAVALEWNAAAGRVAPLGAASLFFSNDDTKYPDFAGIDLASKYRGITLLNLCEDGATIGDVFGFQMPMLEAADANTLITVSMGGNDLLSAFENKQDAGLLTSVVRDIGDAYEFLIESLRRTRPNSTLLLTTVYDPSDGTRRIPGVFDAAGPLPLESLMQLNERIRLIAKSLPRARAADAHQHFQGHGVTAAAANRWYWKRSWIEPGTTGASELRRLWLDALAGMTEN
jgi:lysophospholipase L1-like esterase